MARGSWLLALGLWTWEKSNVVREDEEREATQGEADAISEPEWQGREIEGLHKDFGWERDKIQCETVRCGAVRRGVTSSPSPSPSSSLRLVVLSMYEVMDLGTMVERILERWSGYVALTQYQCLDCLQARNHLPDAQPRPRRTQRKPLSRAQRTKGVPT